MYPHLSIGYGNVHQQHADLKSQDIEIQDLSSKTQKKVPSGRGHYFQRMKTFIGKLSNVNANSGPSSHSKDVSTNLGTLEGVADKVNGVAQQVQPEIPQSLISAKKNLQALRKIDPYQVLRYPNSALCAAFEDFLLEKGYATSLSSENLERVYQEFIDDLTTQIAHGKDIERDIETNRPFLAEGERDERPEKMFLYAHLTSEVANQKRIHKAQGISQDHQVQINILAGTLERLSAYDKPQLQRAISSLHQKLLKARAAIDKTKKAIMAQDHAIGTKIKKINPEFAKEYFNAQDVEKKKQVIEKLKPFDDDAICLSLLKGIGLETENLDHQKQSIKDLLADKSDDLPPVARAKMVLGRLRHFFLQERWSVLEFSGEDEVNAISNFPVKAFKELAKQNVNTISLLQLQVACFKMLCKISSDSTLPDYIDQSQFIALLFTELMQSLPKDEIASIQDLQSELKDKMAFENQKEELIDKATFQLLVKDDKDRRLAQSPQFKQIMKNLPNWKEGEENALIFTTEEISKFGLLTWYEVIDQFFSDKYVKAVLKKFIHPGIATEKHIKDIDWQTNKENVVN